MDPIYLVVRNSGYDLEDSHAVAWTREKANAEAAVEQLNDRVEPCKDCGEKHEHHCVSEIPHLQYADLKVS